MAAMCWGVPPHAGFAAALARDFLVELNAMTFRISTDRCAGAPTTVRLAGRLAGDAVDVLMVACLDIGPTVRIESLRRLLRR